MIAGVILPDVPEHFALTSGERSHPLWARLETEFANRLARARSRNDDASLTADQTAALRGEIKVLKGLLALGKEPPLVE